MSILLSVNQLTKNVGSRSLFEELSFGIFEKEKIGLIGPNGSGKSTLLKILAKVDSPDEGEVTYRKNLNIAFIEQTESFPEDLSVLTYAKNTLQNSLSISPIESEVLAATYLSISGFEDTETLISKLSGGWRKRLAIAVAIAKEPDLLVLDEPTNHMDWEGVLWLESFLKSFDQSFILVSHDRRMLENVTNRTIEINQAFQDGFLSYNLNYTSFLDKKEEHLENQRTLQSSMANKARRETEWLRAGVKARTTKSQSRIKEAHQLLDDLGDLNTKNISSKAKVNIQIDSTKRKTKKLIEFINTNIGYEDNVLIENINMSLGPKQCLGLLGHNGSGKTTLLKAIQGLIEPLEGQIKKAHELKVVYFEQKRSDLPQNESLVEYLGNGSDYVIFKDQSVHVASYASKFLFSSERLHLKIEKLSGGEQARLLIAKIFLHPADVLILDEPTNDLDIATIAVLEELLATFDGLSILVSHDRLFLESLCTTYLGLNGGGHHANYADLNQWLKAHFGSKKERAAAQEVETKNNEKKPVKLSYKDKKFLERAEETILEEESKLEVLNKNLETAVQSADSQKIQELSVSLSKKQSEIDKLYAKWEELNKLKEGL